MSINITELNSLLREYTSLSNKSRLTKEDEHRCAYLQTAIAAVKAGGTLAEVNEQVTAGVHNEWRRANGMPEVSLKPVPAAEREVREYRDMVEGTPLHGQVGSYTGLGTFVPTGFFPQVFAAMKAADALFNDESVTLIKSKNGNPLPIPTAGDTENTATVISEAGSQTSVDIDATGHVTLGAYSYSSDRYVVSMEAFDDLDSAITVTGLLKKFFADKLARGIGKDLVTGSGSGKTLGLIPSLTAIGAPQITAVGSSTNDGSAATGANSIGSDDLQAAISDLDAAYFNENTAWLMNQKTLASFAGQRDKNGNIVRLVEYVDGVPTIFGVPVKICPSLDSIGASKVPVVLGDLSYWATRLITDDSSGLVVYREAPGLIEKGNIGIRCFVRADGGLLYTDASSPSPFVSIRNHS